MILEALSEWKEHLKKYSPAETLRKGEEIMPPTQAEQHDIRYTNPQWEDACLTIRIARAIASSNLPVMPVICIKAHAGPVIDKWLQLLEAALEVLEGQRLETREALLQAMVTAQMRAAQERRSNWPPESH